MSSDPAIATYKNPLVLNEKPNLTRLFNTVKSAALDLIGFASIPFAVATGHYSPAIYLSQPTATTDETIRIINSRKGREDHIFMTNKDLAVYRFKSPEDTPEKYFCNPYEIENITVSNQRALVW